MGTENTMNVLTFYVEPGDILINRNECRQMWRVTPNMGGLRFVPIDNLMNGATTYHIGPGDWIHCLLQGLTWAVRPMQADGNKLAIVPAECVLDHIKEEQGICKPEVEKIEVDKIEPTGEITWVREPTSSAISAPSVINCTKTYTETTIMNNTETTTIPVSAPIEEAIEHGETPKNPEKMADSVANAIAKDLCRQLKESGGEIPNGDYEVEIDQTTGNVLVTPHPWSKANAKFSEWLAGRIEKLLPPPVDYVVVNFEVKKDPTLSVTSHDNHTENRKNFGANHQFVSTEEKIPMEDFCVPVDAFSENKLATEKMLNSGVPCHEIVSTLRRIVNNCEAFLRLKKIYPVKCGEMNVYIDEIYREARNTLGDLGYEAYSIVPEDLRHDVMYSPTEDGTPNGNPVEPEPCALANSREKEQDPLIERFPMLGFDASDCAKILIKRENDSVKVAWLNRLNDILCQIKNSAESGCRGTVYDDIPVSYFAWTHDQMCTDEEKEVKYLMRELEQRGFKVKVLSVPKRGEECEDSNICLGIEW